MSKCVRREHGEGVGRKEGGIMNGKRREKGKGGRERRGFRVYL